GRFDTTFYGIPLGIGIAASGVVVSAWLSRDTLYVPETLGLLLVLSVSLGLVNADTGSIIGFGASRKEMWPSFLRAIGFRFAHAAFLFPFILRVDEPFSAISAATSAGFALLVYYYVYHRILPGTLPEDLRRELRRIAGGPSRLGAEAHRSIEAARRLQYEVRSDEGRKRFLRMRNPKAREHALPIRHGEDLQFQRELDGGRPDSVGAALGLGGDPDDPQVDVPRPDPSHGGRRLSIGLEASRDLRADLADERREFAGGVRPGADARRDH